MKIRIIALALCTSLMYSCKENKTPEVDEDVEVIGAAEEAEAPILLGVQKRDTLESGPYNKWFMQSYKDHTLDQEMLGTIKKGLEDVRITAFMGTWCEDSQREVPALYKILDEVGYESEMVRLITINEDKVTPSGLEQGKEITNVPTFIFMKDGKELGRIVEYPLESLEKDMSKILLGEGYKHAYAE